MTLNPNPQSGPGICGAAAGRCIDCVPRPNDVSHIPRGEFRHSLCRLLRGPGAFTLREEHRQTSVSEHHGMLCLTAVSLLGFRFDSDSPRCGSWCGDSQRDSITSTEHDRGDQCGLGLGEVGQNLQTVNAMCIRNHHHPDSRRDGLETKRLTKVRNKTIHPHTNSNPGRYDRGYRGRCLVTHTSSPRRQGPDCHHRHHHQGRHHRTPH